jgi:hypothetical protein
MGLYELLQAARNVCEKLSVCAVVALHSSAAVACAVLAQFCRCACLLCDPITFKVPATRGGKFCSRAAVLAA